MTATQLTGTSEITKDLLGSLKSIGAATLHEAQGKTGALSHEMKPLDPSSRVAGRALTVLTRPGDNRAIHLAMLEAAPGDVLVIDAFGWKEAGVWGDVLTSAAIHRKLSGVVINGAARDSDSVIDLGLPVFAKALSIKGTAKSDRGVVGGKVTIDGISIERGDFIVGDRDGVVVIPEATIEDVHQAALEKEATEAEWVRQISEGAHTADLLNLR